MAMAFGWMEMLILIGMGGGMAGGDLVSFLPADRYFESRKLPMTVDSLLEAASRAPTDGKAQIAQLLALRTLAERTELLDKAKKSREVIKAIEQIANGELASDKHGFSREYAARTLMALGGEKITPTGSGRGQLIDDLLAWFPAGATLVGGIDSRRVEKDLEGPAELRKTILKLAPEKELDKVFGVAEQLGNIRIDWISFALIPDNKDSNNHRIFVRISGKMDHDRVLGAIKNLTGGKLPLTQKKDAAGRPISILTLVMDVVPHDPPLIAFVGDTDVVVGFPTQVDKLAERQGTLLDLLWAVRSGEKASVLKGALRDELDKVSSKAAGLVVGELPKQLRDASRGGPPVPRSIRVELIPAKIGPDVRFHALMATAEDAATLADFIRKGQKETLANLQNAPLEIPVSAEDIATVKRGLESLQIQAKGHAIQGSILIPRGAFLAPWLLFAAQRRSVPPPAIPKQPR